jgi:hypothetical protein
MALIRLAGSCQGTNCPTVYRDDDGSYVVQGYTAEQSTELTLPVGESAVRVPAALVDELVRAVAG